MFKHFSYHNLESEIFNDSTDTVVARFYTRLTWSEIKKGRFYTFPAFFLSFLFVFPTLLATRQSHDRTGLTKRRTNTTIRSNFFTQRVIDDWNQLPSTIRESRNIKIFKRNLDQYHLLLRWTDPENMTGSPEEDCVEKMLLNAASGGYTNYSPSIQVSIIPTPTPFQHPSQSPLQPSSKTLSKTLFKTLSKNSF